MAEEKNIFLSQESERALYSKLFESLYDFESESVIDGLELFCRWLQDDQEIPEVVAKKMLSSGIAKYIKILRILEDHDNVFRRIFNGYHEFLRESNLTYYKLTSRCKAVVSSVQKMIELLKEGRSLEDLRDIIGFRLVVSERKGESEREAQQRLYKICNESIAYFIELGFLPCNASPLEKKRLQKGVKITIPRQSGILDIYKPYVKDYMFFPKERGYQSLHVVFRIPEGFDIEFQFRTIEMDFTAEYGSASHHLHKAERYSNVNSTKIELEKIKKCGFIFLHNDEDGVTHFIDNCGIIHGRQVFFRDSWS